MSCYYESPNVESKPPISLLGTLLVRANERRALSRGAHSVVILLDGKQTGEKFTTLLVVSPSGGGPGPHYHDREDEWFYMVEGRVSFFLNGTRRPKGQNPISGSKTSSETDASETAGESKEDQAERRAGTAANANVDQQRWQV
jgi:hypothetical protein